jgi:hypothetical protein
MSGDPGEEPGRRKPPENACPVTVRPKCRARGVALLGVVGTATTFVARLSIIDISARTRVIMDLFSVS